MTNRKALESLKKKVIYGVFRPAEGVRLGDDEREMKGWNDCIDHLQTQGYLTPPGMVLVPVEPTEEIEMRCRAAMGEGLPAIMCRYTEDLFHRFYTAMIKAAQGGGNP